MLGGRVSAGGWSVVVRERRTEDDRAWHDWAVYLACDLFPVEHVQGFPTAEYAGAYAAQNGYPARACLDSTRRGWLLVTNALSAILSPVLAVHHDAPLLAPGWEGRHRLESVIANPLESAETILDDGKTTRAPARPTESRDSMGAKKKSNDRTSPREPGAGERYEELGDDELEKIGEELATAVEERNRLAAKKRDACRGWNATLSDLDEEIAEKADAVAHRRKIVSAQAELFEGVTSETGRRSKPKALPTPKASKSKARKSKAKPKGNAAAHCVKGSSSTLRRSPCSKARIV